MTCTECPRTIHPERLAALPRAVTCSSGCSRKRQLAAQKRGARKAMAKRRKRERATRVKEAI